MLHRGNSILTIIVRKAAAKQFKVGKIRIAHTVLMNAYLQHGLLMSKVS